MKKAYLLTLALLLVSCRNETDQTIPFLGLDSKGKVLRHHVVSNFIVKKFSSTLEKSNNEIISGLENASSNGNSAWKLSRITVGIALSLEGQIAQAVKLEPEASFEMRFEPVNN